jgi:hypothetical protein
MRENPDFQKNYGKVKSDAAKPQSIVELRWSTATMGRLMFFHPMRFLLPAALLLSACTTPWLTAPAGPPLKSVRAVRADGTLSAPLKDQDLSPFQRYLRGHLSPPPAGFLAVEADVPDGDGAAGFYLALLRTGGAVELRYVEQSDHLPRTDRYFHRQLTAEEASAVDSFMQEHPLSQLQVISPLPAPAPATQPAVSATAPAAATATEPATGAETMPAATESADIGRDADDLPESGQRVTYRFTESRAGGGGIADARMVEVQSPARDAHPVTDMLRLLLKLRTTGAFECTWLRAIPLTARVLYADPSRQVLAVWTGEADGKVRIAVSGAGGADDVTWMVREAEAWNECPAPGTATQPASQPATEPATQPETAPATQVATPPATGPATTRMSMSQQVEEAVRLAQKTPATLPSAEQIVREWRLSQSRLVPEAETWWTTSDAHATTVYHYVPESPTHGVTHGFVVPAFVFDDAHFAVDAGGAVLYLIYDGQLFSLPIPEGAR